MVVHAIVPSSVVGWTEVWGPRHLGQRLLQGYAVRLSLSLYDADLGMPTYDSIRRQLWTDLPRCLAFLENVRTVYPDTVFRHTFFPRLCTQAVLAPIVEWLLACDVVLYESGRSLYATIVSGDVHVTKQLLMRTWEGVFLGKVEVHVTSQASADALWVRFCRMDT